ncbi:caspase family protein [Candidatus Halobeggiatoa sp. HSG11]|nr:caspase family protein [Candidatus Halobeggiatoa sp. HSG11]
MKAVNMRIVICVLLVGIVQSTYAIDSPRIALLIGNATYEHADDKSLRSLNGPINDVNGMENILSNLGFEVLTLENATKSDMETAFSKFGQRLQEVKTEQNDVVALFYYSGHGVQVNGINYLLSADYVPLPKLPDLFKEIEEAGGNKKKMNNMSYMLNTNHISKLKVKSIFEKLKKIGNIDQIADRKYLLSAGNSDVNDSGIIPLPKLYKKINDINKLGTETSNIFIIDACRNNPLLSLADISDIDKALPIEELPLSNPKSFAIETLQQLLNKNIGDYKEPNNSIIAYASTSGKRAYDILNESMDFNSPYTENLLKIIPQRGISAYEVFQRVGNLVMEDTKKIQQPWLSGSSLDKDFYFAGEIKASMDRGGFE